MDLHVHLDPNGQDLTVEHTQDVEAIIERNKALQKETQKSDWGRHIASIPNVIYVKWFNEEYEKGNVDLKLFSEQMDRIVERKLKDPEWAYLRTDSPQVQGFLGFGS